MSTLKDVRRFPKEYSTKDRVAAIAPLINQKIDAFFDGDDKEGVDTFQEHLTDIIKAAELQDEMVWVQVEKIATHPDNRDKAMLVPIDVHDLLAIFTRKGWVWSKVDVMGCRIPDNATGQEWRAANVKLAKASDGLLAPVENPDALEIAVVRGSHSSAAIRCMKYGTKGIHPETLHEDRVSRSKICESRPSMTEPCEKGLPCTLIKYELVEACPKLMMALSKTGNSSHGVHRVETCLQACKRIHTMIAQRKEEGKSCDKDVIVDLACIGELPGYDATAKCLFEFVKEQSGGKQGQFLDDLEAYEKFLAVKRKLNPMDMLRLSAVKIPQAPNWVVFMVKAMLNAPGSMVSNGFADVFSPSDLSTIMPKGKNLENAIQATKLAIAGREFLDAYSKLPATSINKLASEMEVNFAMHVHGKAVASRKSFDSLLHIAASFYENAVALDKSLPDWPLLRAYNKTKTLNAVSDDGGLRELRVDGSIPNTELFRFGFNVLAKIVRNKGKADSSNKDVYKIASLADSKTVSLQKIVDEDKGKGKARGTVDDNLLVVSRVELLTDWSVQKEVIIEVS